MHIVILPLLASNVTRALKSYNDRVSECRPFPFSQKNAHSALVLPYTNLQIEFAALSESSRSTANYTLRG